MNPSRDGLMGQAIIAAITAMGRFASTVAYYASARPP
jgi:hypothetical protein